MYIRNPETNVWEEVFLPPTGDTYPIGMYGYFAGNNAPTNWLRCDGQEVSRTDYAELFNTIGTTYGSGDGATTFNLPNVNLENRTLVGSSGDGKFSLGNTGGEKEHTLTINEMPAHKHELTIEGGGSLSASGVKWSTGTNMRQYAGDMIEKAGGSQAHNNMQPFMASVCCIKAKQSVGIVGTVTSDINDINDNAVPNAKTVKDYVEEVYSTDEVKTNKIWIDGKPIYRKVYEISSLPNNGRMYVECNIPNVQHVITMRGVMESSTEWNNMPSTYTGGTLIDSLVIERTGNTLTNIRILNNFDRSGFSAFVILEYTKTTL